MQRFRGGLIFEGQKTFVSLNSRLESNIEEEQCAFALTSELGVQGFECRVCGEFPADPSVRGGLAYLLTQEEDIRASETDRCSRSDSRTTADLVFFFFTLVTGP